MSLNILNYLLVIYVLLQNYLSFTEIWGGWALHSSSIFCLYFTHFLQSLIWIFLFFLFSFLKKGRLRNIRRSDKTPSKHRCYRHPQGQLIQLVLCACFCNLLTLHYIDIYILLYFNTKLCWYKSTYIVPFLPPLVLYCHTLCLLPTTH